MGTMRHTNPRLPRDPQNAMTSGKWRCVKELTDEEYERAGSDGNCEIRFTALERGGSTVQKQRSKGQEQEKEGEKSIHTWDTGRQRNERRGKGQVPVQMTWRWRWQ